MTTYLARSAWTSTAAAGATLTGSELVGVAVHWPGTAQAAIGDPGQEKIAERLRSYRNYHVNTRGWSDIGYNFAIDQGGRVWMCRSTQWRGNRVGAHCASASNPRANHKYVGVLLLLGQSEAPSAKMVAAFRDWFHNRFLPGWPGRTDVRGHRQVPGALTNCPGNRAVAAIPILTAKPASGSGSGSGVVIPPPPPPPPPPDLLRKVPDMLMVKQAGTDRIWLIQGNVRRHVTSLTAMRSLEAAGVPLDTEHPISSTLLRSLAPDPQGPDVTDAAANPT